MAYGANYRGWVRRVLARPVRFVVIAIFTGVETATLVGWLALVDGVPAVSRSAVIGLGILVIGLNLEHFLRDLAVNGLDQTYSVGRGILVSLSETVLWVLWLFLAEHFGGLDGFLVAGFVLGVLLVPQHSIGDNILRGRRLLSRFLTEGTIGFSLLEAGGATLWLLFVTEFQLVEPILASVGLVPNSPELVGVGILATTLFVEHAVAVMFARRKG